MSRTARCERTRGGALGFALLLTALLAAPGSLQAEPAEEVFALRHVRASVALEQVVPLLSPAGTVELRQASNELAVRDEPAVLQRVRARLRDLDRPVAPLVVEVQIFEGLATPSGRGGPPLDRELARRLGELLRFAEFRLVTSGRVVTREGERIHYQAGDGFQVRFQAGHIGANGRLRLEGFALEQADAAGNWTPLVEGRLQVAVGRPLVLALAAAEDAPEALFLALTVRRPPAVAAGERQ